MQGDNQRGYRTAAGNIRLGINTGLQPVVLIRHFHFGLKSSGSHIGRRAHITHSALIDLIITADSNLSLLTGPDLADILLGYFDYGLNG
ncbi:hypothetical protein SDC9_203798 [bioreactor metagenome]|uniref:Uncharacterized protein n=1 Tax=bioreactor metagenome TaxID=1076179 RepID=A0A645IZ28_9ZZZZ